MDIAEDVVSGTTYLHFNNSIHRDLKSLNILITKKYEAKICDFGQATLKIATASKSDTSSRIGTIRWMAREVTRRPANTQRLQIPMRLEWFFGR